MGKVAFVFPGQGSQYLGMGKDIYDKFPEVQEFYHRAGEKLGFDIAKIIFEDEKKLNLTMYTQPSLVLTSYSTYYLFKNKKNLHPDFVAGHSLGEFTALLVADSLSLEDAVFITYIRGKLMQEAVPEGVGAMAAVIGLDAKEIEEVLKQINGIVEIANYNSYEQTVISGETKAVEEAMQILKEKGAKKVVKLAVSVPAHSSMLREKAVEFGKYLDEIQIKDAKYPVVSNITATPIKTREEIRKELQEHFYSPVRWVQTVEFLSNNGVDTVYEIGPKKVLTGLIRRINKGINLHNIEKLSNIEKL